MKPMAVIVAALAGAALLPMHANAATPKPQPAKTITLAQMSGTPDTVRPDRINPQFNDRDRNATGDRDHDRDHLRGRSGGTMPPGLDRDDHNRKGMGRDMDRDHDRDRDNMRGRSGGTMPPGLDRNHNRNGGGDMDHDRDGMTGRTGSTPDVNRH